MSGLEAFNKRGRPNLFQRLAAESFDLLILGGGVLGASVFRDAVLRGLRVALLEGRDFASGTSSRSSKLVHGGLRHLRHLDLDLVWECCQERNLHVRLNRRFVRPAPFLVPLYRGHGPSRTTFRVGMILYDLLSGLRNHRCHRFLGRAETLHLAPGLPTAGLLGGCVYFDAVVNDSRWTIEIVKDGVRHGGLAVNHAPVVALLRERGQLVGAVAEDQVGGRRVTVRARAIVNAAGVWVDALRRLDDPEARPLLRRSRGTHLVFAERDVPLRMTTAFFSRLDDRPLFLVRREGCFLYGTTDEWVTGEPGPPVPDVKDCEYLLGSLHSFLPGAGLDAEKVRFVYSGFRPLLAADRTGCEPTVAPTEVGRDEVIEVARSGLISVAGGKLTTARRTALRVLEKVLARPGKLPGVGGSRTHLIPVGGRVGAEAAAVVEWERRLPVVANQVRALQERYGGDAAEICSAALAAGSQDGDPWGSLARAEIEYLCRREAVCTLEDLADRRVASLSWGVARRLQFLREHAETIRAELDLSVEEFEAQYREYVAHLRTLHTVPQLLPGPLLLANREVTG